MDIQILTTLIVTAVTVAAFAYSIVMLVRSRQRGYFQTFCVFAFFSFAAGHVFNSLLEAVGENSYYFTLGSLGTVSGLLCIAFACKTVQKVDEEEDAGMRRKHSLMALIAPAYFAVCWVIMLCLGLGAQKMIIATLYLFSALPCSYFCLRNVITPYPEGSMLRCMKPFFITVLVYCANIMLSELTWVVTNGTAITVLTYTLSAVSAACFILMPVMLERGNRKWRVI